MLRPNATAKVRALIGRFDADVRNWQKSVVEWHNGTIDSDKEKSFKIWQFVGDNVDLYKRTRDASKQNVSLHWFHLVAVKERVPPPIPLTANARRASILTVPIENFLPSYDDIQCFRAELRVLILLVS